MYDTFAGGGDSDQVNRSTAYELERAATGAAVLRHITAAFATAA
jgi:hypothetical protein